MLFQKQCGQGSGLGLAIVRSLGKCVGGGIGLSGSWDDLEVEQGEELSPPVSSSVKQVQFPEISKVLVVRMYLKLLSVEVVLPFLKSLDDC